MQIEDTQNEGMAASEAPAASSPSSEGAPAPETNGEQPKETLLDAVRQVVNTSDEGEEVSEGKEEAPSSEEAEGEDQAEGEEQKAETEDQDEEAPSADVPEKTRKKINSLLKQRRELRHEVTALKPVAEIGEQMQVFAQTHDLGGDDIVNALHIAATLRRGDYKAFYEMVSPYVRHAQEYLGVILPDDLNAAVQQEQITEEYARQFAKTRFDQQRMEIQQQRVQDLSTQYFTNEVQQDVQRAVTDFETRLSASDPDYKAKAGLVERTARALLAERGGTVTTKEEALTIVKTAYDEVNAHFRKLAPARRATPPTPSSASSQTHSARPAPKNLMEAVVAGLNATRR